MDGIKPRPVMEVKVNKVSLPTSTVPKKKRKVTGVTSTIYKPFPQELYQVNLVPELKAAFHGMDPEPGYMRI